MCRFPTSRVLALLAAKVRSAADALPTRLIAAALRGWQFLLLVSFGQCFLIFARVLRLAFCSRQEVTPTNQVGGDG